MTRRRAVLAALLLSGASSLGAQVRTQVRINPIYEGYSFDAGLVFNKVSEITVPVGIDLGLGRMGSLAISTGYATVSLTSADKSQLADQQISGLLDTEFRYSYNLVPGKFIFIATGSIPTGVKTVQQDQLSILGALSSDIIGFSASTLGSGGNVGGGFVGAVPMGRFALGLGATYKLPLSYQPVLGRTDELKPGAEMRLRTGLEGPLGRTTYFRLAGIYARTQKDQVAGVTLNGVGNRLISYASLNQGLGKAQALFYAFDVARGSPQVEATAAGAAILPRGNLVAAGLRLAYAMSPTLSVTPRIEFRVSAAAPDTATTALERLGRSTRIGADLRHDTGRFAAEVRAGFVSGYVVQGGSQINLSGFRGAVQVEMHP